MTIRTASLSRQIRKNGERLHRAGLVHLRSRAADQAPSEAEVVLLEERRRLKEARAARAAQAQLPRARPKPAWMLKPPKPPKPPKAHKEKSAKDAKSPGAKKPSRADKQVRKAESLEAAKKASKKSAKT